MEDTRELLDRYAAGDPSAAEELVRSQMDRIHALCASLVRNPETAAELSQEAVLRLYRSLPRFRGDCAWSTWSYRIARNLCLNWLEKMREEVGEDGGAVADVSPDPLQLMAEGERQLGLRRALDEALSEQEREAMLLHYEAGLTVEEVTEVMGLENRTGARGVLQRARRKLRREVVTAMSEDSIVQRGMSPLQRAELERTLAQLSRTPEQESGPEPELRPMRRRGQLLD